MKHTLTVTFCSVQEKFGSSFPYFKSLIGSATYLYLAETSI